MNIFSTLFPKKSASQNSDAKVLNRRAFLKSTTGLGVGVALTTSVAGIAAASGNSAQGAVAIGVRTGWTKEAAQTLVKRLSGYSNPLKAVSNSHVVASDAVIKTKLSHVALNAPAGTHYYVAISNADTQPTSEAEAAQIVYNVSVWKITKPEGSTSLDEISIERAYSKSLRDRAAISSATAAGAQLLPFTTELATVRRYERFTVNSAEAQAINAQSPSLTPSVFLPLFQ